MDDLPLIPAMKIFNCLSIEDILNMKLVNKWFHQIINENVKIKDLVVSAHDYLPCNRRWFYTWDLIKPQNLVKYNWNNNVYFNLHGLIILDQFKYLKRLCIFKSNVTLETLNSLNQLVHLEIIESRIKSITDNNILSLPMLEILNLDAPKFDLAPLIDSIKLQRLKISRFFVELVHKESITYLEVDEYRSCEHFLRSCINLQHFYTYTLQMSLLYGIELLKNFPKINSIHFDEYHSMNESFDEIRSRFVNFVNQKKNLKKNLKIYFHNLELHEVPIKTFINGKFLDLILSESYAEHYSRLADCCPFIESVDYNSLERCFIHIPENFMYRFVNLTTFKVDEKIQDLDQLIRVLSECRTITSIKLPSSLGQHFFDFHLYDLCPYIDTLDITSDEVLNCEFILKFKNIRQLCVKHQTLSLELVRRLVETQIMTFRFNFYHQDLFQIKIVKFRYGSYELAISKPNQRFDQTHSLVLKNLDDLDKLEWYCDDSKNKFI